MFIELLYPYEVIVILLIDEETLFKVSLMTNVLLRSIISCSSYFSLIFAIPAFAVI